MKHVNIKRRMQNRHSGQKHLQHLPQKDMMWLLSACTNFLVTASSIICFTWERRANKSFLHSVTERQNRTKGKYCREILQELMVGGMRSVRWRRPNCKFIWIWSLLPDSKTNYCLHYSLTNSFLLMPLIQLVSKDTLKYSFYRVDWFREFVVLLFSPIKLVLCLWPWSRKNKCFMKLQLKGWQSFNWECCRQAMNTAVIGLSVICAWMQKKER